ncbi:hypothetical protein [Corynebacterium rouxii]|uniref:Uncharacterized protein n=1 Tax=Corynebacterium rouxii TaxID=2719119 RepID=A0A6I8MFY5_9CORY|nr:hypothetical protein [Corynebacterium rouxii]MDT9408886.1 hypothetical protein [Corynebacterium rouxii]MDT9411067.1 hypothetical protein [Corynebacterium rouxii]VZH85282.1 hypothetical protein FRC0190_01253 [Corynebacterium rouxii]
MNIRDNLYSPLQNASLWIGAWLYGHVSIDDADYSLTELFGQGQLVGFGNGNYEIFRILKNHTGPLHRSVPNEEPLLRLLLGGPGDPIYFPEDVRAKIRSQAKSAPQAAIAVALAQPHIYGFLIPRDANSQGSTQWNWITSDEPMRLPAVLSPGEADFNLAEATRHSAVFIEKHPNFRTPARNPRLTVGRLTDFYENPGLPEQVAPRALKLIARADTVASIVEGVTQSLQEHAFDPHLFPLAQHVRHARMAAVSYAFAEWGR